MDLDEKQPQDAENPEKDGQEEDKTDWKAEAMKYKAMAERRAKRLAAQAKTKEPKEEKQAKTGSSGSSADIVAEDDKIYYFTRMKGTRTGLHQIRKIMKATGKTFDQALKDDLYVAYLKKVETDEKRRKSQLGPSKGSIPEKGGIKPGTKKEKSFLEAMGVKEKK